MPNTRSILFATALAVLAGPAGAQGTAAIFCSLDHAPAVPCTMADRVLRDGRHVMDFRLGGRQVRFVGRAQTGWWSGTLDGRPAMGHELNRGHVRYSTGDLKTAFAWWYAGREHGTY